MEISIKISGNKGGTRTERELDVNHRELHTVAHRAVMKFFEDPINKKRKRDITDMWIHIKK